jgi:hypothetical protein
MMVSCGLAGYVVTAVAASPATKPANPLLNTIKIKEADVPCGEQWYIIVIS